MKEPQQVTTEPQSKATQLPSRVQPVHRVTTKNPKKVEAGKRLAESNHKRREAKKQVKLEGPVNQYHGIGAVGIGSWSYRWSWLLDLSNKESRATTRRSATK